MNLFQYFCFKVMEESAEVSHRASKLAQFGPDEIEQADGQTLTNAERYKRECHDLDCVKFLLDSFMNNEFVQINDPLWIAKIARMKTYMKLSVDLGEIPQKTLDHFNRFVEID